VFMFVERQEGLPGRGLFVRSFADLGTAMILASMDSVAEATFVIDGTDHWLQTLLGDPDWLLRGLAKGTARPGRDDLAGLLQGGVAGFRRIVDEARKTWTCARPEYFFDGDRFERANLILDTAWDVFQHETHRLDPSSHPRVRWLLAQILSRGVPRLVGFSLPGIADPITAAVIWELHRRRIPTVGGGWPTLGLDVPGMEHLKTSWGLDWVASGPGELVLPGLYEALRTGRRPNMENLVGEGIDEPCLAALDGLPEWSPKFDGSGDTFFAPALTVPLSSNAGCYWKRCVFCPQAYNVHPYMERRVEFVVRQVEQAVEGRGARHFFFVDECISPSFATEFSRIIAAKNMGDVHFASMVRPETAFGSDLLQDMATAGFDLLLWGVESMDQDVLRRMRKGTSPAGIRRVLEASWQAGISNYLFLMTGFPGQTMEQTRQTLAFVRSHRQWVDGVQLSRFVAYTGSQVGRSPALFGVQLGGPSDRELASLDVSGGVAPRAEQDAVYEDFRRHYQNYVSGRYPSFPHDRHSSRGLLALLYRGLGAATWSGGLGG